MQSSKPTIVDLPNSVAPWLSDIRQLGVQQWGQSAWPTRKTEHWKYTPLKALENIPASVEGGISFSAEALANFAIDGLDAHRMVFCEGRFQAQLSDDVAALPDGVELVSFAQASERQIELIKTYLDSSVVGERHVFASLNKATLQDGLFLFVPSGITLERPVCVVHVAGDAADCQSAPRLLVVAEKSSALTVVEQFVTTETHGNQFATSISEFLVDENAQLNHIRLHMEDGEHRHVGGVHMQLQANARVNGFYAALGCQLQRNDIVVHYQGQGAECELNGVYAPIGDQHVDFHTCIEHAVPQCTSTETFRGIIGDRARAVFHGRIHIHPNAQKTLAQLNNRNLLTSAEAEVDTKPELEIYADDVQCAHGATVAQLDKVALHYFRTRGISQREAEVMLSFGFINELLNKISLPAVADYLRPILAERFARDPKLLRHIA